MKRDETSSKKDVIYIDIEDDITSIIEKVKAASTSIVALVPPKRIGALQSVVNLKLLGRAAETADKRVVLITSDHGLSALAAGVALPVAKNLQSKPEIPEAPEPDVDNDDVIEGDETTVTGATDEDEGLVVSAPDESPEPAAHISRRTRPGVAVPDFDAFRNKIALIGGGIAIVIAFFVWAIFFAPHATITITAKTTPYGVSKSLTATPGATLDADKGVLAANVLL